MNTAYGLHRRSDNTLVQLDEYLNQQFDAPGIANAGDSQLAGGGIWPLSSQDSLSLGAQSTVVSADADIFRVNTGSEVELLYLWKPSGPLPVEPFTITDINKIDENEYELTVDGSQYTLYQKAYNEEEAPYLQAVKYLFLKPKLGFINVAGYSSAADGGDCVWKYKGFNASKAGDDFDLSLMELYDAYGNIYEPYGVFGAQKLQIKPNAIGAVGDFLNGSGKDNIAELEALRDYLQGKGGGVILLDRFSFYGVSRSFKMSTSRFTSADYVGTGQDCGFGKLDSFVVSPAPTATLDSVIRMNANDFLDSVGTFTGWDCTSFAIQGMDGSVDNVSCMSVVGAVRTSRVDFIRTDGGYDGIALTSCFSHVFTRNQTEGAYNIGQAMGFIEYGNINDVVVNVSEFSGNVARGCGNWGLHYKFGNSIGMDANTYELNDKNCWIQDCKSGQISNLYVEGARGVDGIELKIGGNASEAGVVQRVGFSGVIAAFGGQTVLVRGMQDCTLENFRLFSGSPITSDNSGENRVVRNRLINAAHDSTISKTTNITDTFIEDVTNNSTQNSRFTTIGYSVRQMTNANIIPATTSTQIVSQIRGAAVVVLGESTSNTSNRFLDVVYFIPGVSTPVVENKVERGNPPTRTYTATTLGLFVEVSSESIVTSNVMAYSGSV